MPKKAFITFFKNHGMLSEKTVELFKVRWDDDAVEWVRDDENGTHWGMIHPATEEVTSFYIPPEKYGTIETELEHVEFTPPPVPEMLRTKLVTGTPTLGVVDEEENEEDEEE